MPSQQRSVPENKLRCAASRRDPATHPWQQSISLSERYLSLGCARAPR